MKNFVSKLVIVCNILIISALIPYPANAEKTGNLTNLNYEKTNISEEKFFEDEEEKVIISIINFGRKNPFKPYTLTEEISFKSKEKVINIDDIPFPPAYKDQTEMSRQAEALMNSKVNGILYDPYAKSVAIVNIKGSEYMLHKGDMVHGIMVDSINQNNITLKYGSNTYTVGVGDIVEGSFQQNPVQRKQKIFAGSSDSQEYNLPQLHLEE